VCERGYHRASGGAAVDWTANRRKTGYGAAILAWLIPPTGLTGALEAKVALSAFSWSLQPFAASLYEIVLLADIRLFIQAISCRRGDKEWLIDSTAMAWALTKMTAAVNTNLTLVLIRYLHPIATFDVH
jgi:hypothetical protein